MRQMLVLLASMALVFTGAAPAGGAVASPYKVDGVLMAVASTPGSDTIWAARTGYRGGNGLVSYVPGVGWTNYRLPNDGTHVEDIDMVSDTAGWAVAINDDSSAGYLLRWDGTQWSTVATEAFDTYGGMAYVSGTGPDDAWIAGWAGTSSTVWHWNGTTLEALTVPLGTRSSITGAIALAPDDVWLTANRPGQPPIALHYDGADWTDETLPLPDAHAIDLTATPDGDLWALGMSPDFTATLLHRVSGAWQSIPAPFNMDFWGVWPGLAVAANGEAWVGINERRLAHYDGSQWTSTKFRDTCQLDRYQLIRDITIAESGTVYAAGGCYGWRRYTSAYSFDSGSWSRI